MKTDSELTDSGARMLAAAWTWSLVPLSLWFAALRYGTGTRVR